MQRSTVIISTKINVLLVSHYRIKTRRNRNNVSFTRPIQLPDLPPHSCSGVSPTPPLRSRGAAPLGPTMMTSTCSGPLGTHCPSSTRTTAGPPAAVSWEVCSLDGSTPSASALSAGPQDPGPHPPSAPPFMTASGPVGGSSHSLQTVQFGF